MGITYAKSPPPEDEPPRSAGKGSAKTSERPVYQKEARSPRGRKAVYVDTLTEARLTQAAAELGLNRDDMANEAVIEFLRREAAALFEREFRDADQNSPTTIPRHEFKESWRGPSWLRE